MTPIAFITGNEYKFKEAQQIVPQLVQKVLDLTEIQELDARKIVEHKLEEAFAKTGEGNIVVEDTSFSYTALNGFPGPLIKWMYDSVGSEGMWKLIENYEDRSGEIITIVGYKDDSGENHYFESRIDVNTVAPRGENGFGWIPLSRLPV